MGEHLSPEKLKMFLNNQLTADEELAIMLHLEDCNQCYELMPEQTTEEIWQMFLGDESEQTEKSESETETMGFNLSKHKK